MKILMVNKFHYIKGGSETYYFALKKKLEEEGHEVIDFSMTDNKNLVSNYSNYFVKKIDYNDENIIRKIKAAIGIVYSFEAKKKFEKLILDTNPDIIHLHIFQHQISPSILDVIKKYDIPTVYTAHDLKMICLNYKMMHHGQVCEDCKNGKMYLCALNCCVKNSFFKSLINVIEGYIHKWRKSYDVIDQIITPSLFYKKKFQEFDVDYDRVKYIPNFIDKEKPKINLTSDSKKYFLYFGRLSEEKGIITLINAIKSIKERLYIVGTGPLEEYLKNYIEKKDINNICLLGFKSGQELFDIIGNAKAVIIPSEWYENGPYSAIEAIQMGRPIIGANIGGIPELIEGNGYLFEPGDTEGLKATLKKMSILSKREYELMEECSYKLFEKKYTWQVHSKYLLEVYQSCLHLHKNRKRC